MLRLNWCKHFSRLKISHMSKISEGMICPTSVTSSLTIHVVYLSCKLSTGQACVFSWWTDINWAQSIIIGEDFYRWADLLWFASDWWSWLISRVVYFSVLSAHFIVFKTLWTRAGLDWWQIKTKTASEMHVAPRIVVHCCPLLSTSAKIRHDLLYHRLPLTGLHAFVYTGLNDQKLHVDGYTWDGLGWKAL